MNHYVADTHALFWYFTNSPKLGLRASAVFDEADNGQALIFVPAIAVAELYFVNRKYGAPLVIADVVAQLQQSAQFELVSFEAADVLEFDAHAAVPEMHDRIIVGVALQFNVPCLTRDSQVVNSHLVQTIW